MNMFAVEREVKRCGVAKENLEIGINGRCGACDVAAAVQMRM